MGGTATGEADGTTRAAGVYKECDRVPRQFGERRFTSHVS